MAPSAGWYEDPQDASKVRYWDGAAWTEQVAPRTPPTVSEAPQWIAPGAQQGPPFAGQTQQWQYGARPGPPQWPDSRQLDRPARAGPSTTDGVPLATWGRRGLARVLDLILMSFIGLPATGYFLYRVYQAEQDQHQTGITVFPTGQALHWYLLFGVVQFVLLFCYEILCLRRWGHTIGKMLLGISVRTRDQAGVLPWSAAVRRAGFIYAVELVGLVPVVGLLGFVLLLLDYLRPLWDRRRQSLHDHVAGTVVVVGGRDIPPARRDPTWDVSA